MSFSPQYSPATDHTRLGDLFYDVVEPARFPQHILRYRNQRAAASVGLDTLTDEEWIEHFGRFSPLPGSLPHPLALRYHGHQFRQYNPDLGDGRGFLFAQLRDTSGRLLDLGTKGSGRTPWSRGGDGRLTLKGGVREVLAASMLEALGADTSRAFSLIETGEKLDRHDEPSPTRSAVLVRLGHSHIRIGTFQRLAAHAETAAIGRLITYVLETYYPELTVPEGDSGALMLFEAVCERVARTGAQWMAAGFVHGVLNTDNIAITGESFDYGPWRFLPRFEPGFTAAYFDHQGLYAYGRQPAALGWNLARLAECLLEFAPHAGLTEILSRFPARYEAELDAAWIRRLGVAPCDEHSDRTLRQAVTLFMEESGIPFDALPFDWFGGGASTERVAASPRAPFYQRSDFAPVRTVLEKRTPAAGVTLDHRYFAGNTPCTMLIDTVESLWTQLAEHDDWGTLEAKLAQIDEMAVALGNRSPAPSSP
ncbi:protein adenylyltransferase SelO [Acetobacter estunensis]|uniref:protein adenylyltransferase SelO n=1 Tax=Acetobacter estunensis TaxID=104097 RepID=UPI001C2D1FC8|nr:YdiU family protein [Acetobacter estunensis]MBV1835860.1 YdiU family protein [Acetobacter estunensis]MBV1835879.1 YdiU family protein [Acetobacter estunensis]